jgi:hypothetical protein
VPEEQRVPRSDPVADLGLVHVVMQLVGHEHHHDVAARGRVGDIEHLEASRARRLGRGRLRAETDHDVDARVLEVQGVGVALGAEPDDRDGLAVEEGEVRVVVVIHGRLILSRRRSSLPTVMPAPTRTHIAIT